MYDVSEAFRAAIKDPVQQHRLHGKIIVKGVEYEFNQENIAKKSFSMTNQCSGNEQVDIGSVYTAELTASFLGMDLPRYDLKDAEIIPYFDLHTENGWETVPLGIFYIKEAGWTIWGIEVTANDSMTFFDKEISFDTTYGSIWDFLTLACNKSGVELGMNELQVKALPNGMAELAVYTENDMETWRDLVYWCAVTTGTFATINRAGALELRSYGVTPVDELDSDHRYKDARFSDFETRYTAVKLTVIESGEVKRCALQPDNGLTLDLGENPFLQYGTEDEIEQRCQEILNAVAVIDYVPMEVTMSGNPAYDLGDVLVFSEGVADATKISCITSFDWIFGGDYEIVGVGKNPALENARSKIDKQLQGVRSGISSEEIVFYQFTNAKAINIGPRGKKTIADIRYTSLSQRIAIFQLEALLDVETVGDEEQLQSAVAKVNYILNDVEISGYHPTETWIDGKHILHLLYYLEVESNLMQRLTVELEMSGGSVKIDQNNVHCSIYGQGLAATDKWDGTFDVKDVITIMELTDPKGIEGMGLTDAAEILPMVPEAVLCIDEIAVMELTDPEGIKGMGLTDTAELII